jgi:endo-alpha-1,4-polygalactosaminidase (GH114 family)
MESLYHNFVKNARNKVEGDEIMEKYYIEIDGVQVFTADYVFEQMQSQNRRIERIFNMAKISCTVSCIAGLFSVVAIILSTLL